jgi:hypothetical protein
MLCPHRELLTDRHATHKETSDLNTIANGSVVDPDPAFQASPDPDVLMTKNSRKNLNVDFFLPFLDQKLQFTLASIKDVQATGEAFSPQKRTSSTSTFCTPGSGFTIGIRIH